MTAVPKRGVILDRDATLIDVVRDEETGVLSVAFHPDHLRWLPGVIDGLVVLRDAGYAFAIATNQPGPAKGQMSTSAVERTNRALVERLSAEGITIDSVEVCLHHPTGAPGGEETLVGSCECRKPKPGMLRAAMTTLGLEAEHAWMIGDSMDDLRAARAVGIRVGLVFPTNRCQLCPLRDGPSVGPDVVGPRFDDVARAIVRADATG